MAGLDDLRYASLLEMIVDAALARPPVRNPVRDSTTAEARTT
jgi:1,4-dihydroxy-2-naphthoyl-CoA synthase